MNGLPVLSILSWCVMRINLTPPLKVCPSNKEMHSLWLPLSRANFVFDRERWTPLLDLDCRWYRGGRGSRCSGILPVEEASKSIEGKPIALLWMWDSYVRYSSLALPPLQPQMDTWGIWSSCHWHPFLSSLLGITHSPGISMFANGILEGLHPYLDSDR